MASQLVDCVPIQSENNIAACVLLVAATIHGIISSKTIILRGSDLSLSCQTNLSSDFTYWTSQEKRIQDGKDLNLTNIQHEECYKCVAFESKHNTDEKEFCTGPIYEYPRIYSITGGNIFFDNDVVNLSCNSNVENIRWILPNKTTVGKRTLYFPKFKSTYSGAYTCRADNGVGNYTLKSININHASVSVQLLTEEVIENKLSTMFIKLKVNILESMSRLRANGYINLLGRSNGTRRSLLKTNIMKVHKYQNVFNRFDDLLEVEVRYKDSVIASSSLYLDVKVTPKILQLKSKVMPNNTVITCMADIPKNDYGLLFIYHSNPIHPSTIEVSPQVFKAVYIIDTSQDLEHITCCLVDLGTGIHLTKRLDLPAQQVDQPIEVTGEEVSYEFPLKGLILLSLSTFVLSLALLLMSLIVLIVILCKIRKLDRLYSIA